MEEDFNFLGAQIQESKFHTPAIQLPNQKSSHEVFFSIDIGGSLVKIIYYQADIDSNGQPYLKQGTLHFEKFETSKINDVINFIKLKLIRPQLGSDSTIPEDIDLEYKNQQQDQELPPVTRKIKITGGGAFKYEELLQKELNIEIEKEDEMLCLVNGCNFFLKAICDEVYGLDGDNNLVYYDSQDEDLYPYLLVNIGSGVSMIKVESDGTFKRVNGSTLGGGTFLGLAKLLTKIDSFDEILELSEKGNYKTVDLLVGDIYGGRDYSKIGLNSDVVASAFGKIIAQGASDNYKVEDIALSLSRMISFNIGQLAYFTAALHNIKKIFFGGFFIRGMKSTSYYIKFAVEFFSKNQMTATFLRHDGYLGAMGAFLKISQNPIFGKNRAQFQENYSSASHLKLNKQLYEQHQILQGARTSVDTVRPTIVKDENRQTSIRNYFDANLQKQYQQLAFSPSQKLNLEVGELLFKPDFDIFSLLADPQGYEPNTFDFLLDQDERAWWQNFLEQQISKITQKAIKADGGTEGAIGRAELYKQAFIVHLRKWKDQAFGRQGLPEILSFQEQSLHEFGFYDIYKSDKEFENELSLKLLPETLHQLDQIENKNKKLLKLIQGVLASNIFDWGSEAYLAKKETQGFQEIYNDALQKLSQRPWRGDDFDNFSEQTYNQFGSINYNKVMIFTDNAGADLILGIIPLVRQFLSDQSDVVLVANARPAYNDVTLPELQIVLHQVQKICPIIKSALLEANKSKDKQKMHIKYEEDKQFQKGIRQSQPKLEVISSGLSSPCLDFRRVSRQVAVEHALGTELIILDGMGRSIHTNYHTAFKCDSLKLAMVKNERMAKRYFNGQLYDCVCRFDKGTTF